MMVILLAILNAWSHMNWQGSARKFSVAVLLGASALRRSTKETCAHGLGHEGHMATTGHLFEGHEGHLSFTWLANFTGITSAMCT